MGHLLPVIWQWISFGFAIDEYLVVFNAQRENTVTRLLGENRSMLNNSLCKNANPGPCWHIQKKSRCLIIDTQSRKNNEVEISRGSTFFKLAI